MTQADLFTNPAPAPTNDRRCRACRRHNRQKMIDPDPLCCAVCSTLLTWQDDEIRFGLNTLKS